ncbi:class I SAM-dependent methyltransferase [Nocardioides sp. LHG3406-4]|uniref:class I SAM-dependent methyltransferase n=1 Tax=Nocardioides sp. LHG3406-4 TaxID=2804575 RepID=UPI003CEE8718
MTFEVAADAYGRFMGRFSEPLAPVFADWCGVRPGQRALDVGCGPGALTGALVERLGGGRVAALDPSPPFVAAARARFPEVEVRQATAERIPWADDEFDCALAQLVVHFMGDPVAGLREMSRAVRPGGVVAACVWDFAGGRSPLTTFWRAVAELEPGHAGEAELAGTREGQLAELCDRAGLTRIEQSDLTVRASYATFEEWWEPYTHGVGPAGSHVASLAEGAREELRARCEELCPPAPFEVTASAWVVRAQPPAQERAASAAS